MVKEGSEFGEQREALRRERENGKNESETWVQRDYVILELVLVNFTIAVMKYYDQSNLVGEVKAYP